MALKLIHYDFDGLTELDGIKALLACLVVIKSDSSFTRMNSVHRLAIKEYNVSQFSFSFKSLFTYSSIHLSQMRLSVAFAVVESMSSGMTTLNFFSFSMDHLMSPP
jgi:hypothetical protein